MMAIYVIYNTFRGFNDKSSYAGSILMQVYLRFYHMFLHPLSLWAQTISSVLIIQPHKTSGEFSISINPVHIKDILNITMMNQISSFHCYQIIFLVCRLTVSYLHPLRDLCHNHYTISYSYLLQHYYE